MVARANDIRPHTFMEQKTLAGSGTFGAAKQKIVTSFMLPLG